MNTLVNVNMNIRITLLFSLSLFFYCANAFNITNVLNNYSDFSSFNQYLTQTELAGQINSRRTITVLAVDNGALSSIEGKSSDLVKKILSVHIVLDYYDASKIKHLANKSTILTTLFQSSGHATGQQGFLNVTDGSSGSVMFGSAAKGSNLDASLVKSVVSQPYNLSVLQISTVIVPMGIENSTTSPSPAPAPGKSKPPAKSPSPRRGGPPAPSDAAPSDDASAPPKADAPAADKTPSASAATTFGLSLSLVMMIILSTPSLVSMT